MSHSPEEIHEMEHIEKAHRLAAVAQVLRENRMPQETINMVLAVRCGLPMDKIDPKSPCFAWVGEPDAVEPAPDATSENESREERFRRLRAKALSVVEGEDWWDVSRVLTAVLNDVLAPSGEQAVVTLRPLVVYSEVDGKI